MVQPSGSDLTTGSTAALHYSAQSCFTAIAMQQMVARSSRHVPRGLWFVHDAAESFLHAVRPLPPRGIAMGYCKERGRKRHRSLIHGREISRRSNVSLKEAPGETLRPSLRSKKWYFLQRLILLFSPINLTSMQPNRGCKGHHCLLLWPLSIMQHNLWY